MNTEWLIPVMGCLFHGVVQQVSAMFLRFLQHHRWIHSIINKCWDNSVGVRAGVYFHQMLKGVSKFFPFLHTLIEFGDTLDILQLGIESSQFIWLTCQANTWIRFNRIAFRYACIKFKQIRKWTWHSDITCSLSSCWPNSRKASPRNTFLPIGEHEVIGNLQILTHYNYLVRVQGLERRHPEPGHNPFYWVHPLRA